MAFDSPIPLQERTEALTQSILDSVSQALILLDPQHRIRALNRSASRLFELHPGDALGRPFQDLLAPAEQHPLGRRALGRHSWRGVARTSTGTNFDAEFSRTTIVEKGATHCVIAVDDLTQQHRFEDALHSQRRLCDLAMEHTSDAILTTDTSGVILSVNRSAHRLLKQSDADLLGARLVSVVRFRNPHHNEQLDADIYRILHQGGTTTFRESAELLRKQNQAIAVDGHLVALDDRAGQISGCLVTIRDISTELRMQAVLSFKATHDELTGLINRREFERRVQEQVLRSMSTREPSSMLKLDLDRFKLVNDNYSHVAGDQLLRQLTQVLLSQIRSSDTLARIGGDEFALLLPGCDKARAYAIAENLRNVTTAFRLAWDDDRIAIDVSIGVVTLDLQMQNSGDVMSAADAALLMAKESGRNCVVVYHAGGLEEQRRRGEALWAPRIREALEHDRFRLYCQPIVPINPDIAGDWGCEILVRMLDNQGELIPPMAFIPAAERYDLMTLIDRWVIRSLTEQWQASPEVFSQIEKCNINLSGQSLAQPGFLDFVRNQFAVTGRPFDRVCFEITETAVVANMENARHLIRELSAAGCRFALDDFGSGLSSFAYLKHLPVDYLKIDGVFVRDMLQEPMDAAMVRAIADIGHTLGLETVAEFVENDATLIELRHAGVDYAQGYGVQRPFPLSDLVSYRPSQLTA